MDETAFFAALRKELPEYGWQSCDGDYQESELTRYGFIRGWVPQTELYLEISLYPSGPDYLYVQEELNDEFISLFIVELTNRSDFRKVLKDLFIQAARHCCTEQKLELATSLIKQSRGFKYD